MPVSSQTVSASQTHLLLVEWIAVRMLCINKCPAETILGFRVDIDGRLFVADLCECQGSTEIANRLIDFASWWYCIDWLISLVVYPRQMLKINRVTTTSFVSKHSKETYSQQLLSAASSRFVHLLVVEQPQPLPPSRCCFCCYCLILLI